VGAEPERRQPWTSAYAEVRECTLPSTIGDYPHTVTIRVELTPDEVIVAPGDEETLTLTVESSDEAADTYGFVATGLSRGWTTIEPPSLRLLPGASGTATVTVRPPRLPSVGAGSSSFEIKVFPLRDPDSETTVDGTLTILGFDDRLIHIAQPVLAARRTARYDIVFDNVGNVRASTRLTLIDNTRRLKGTFDPPSLGVEPGMTATARLSVRTKGVRWRRTRTLPFSVQATQDNHRSTETTANLVQHPVISTRQTGWFFGLLALGGLVVGGWYGAVRPAINRAVDRAVAKTAVSTPVTASSTPLGPISTGPIDPSATAAPPTVATAIDDSIGSMSVAIQLTATPGASFVKQITDVVPAGKVLQIRDVVFFNPNHDSGVFNVQRDNEVVEIIPTENVSVSSSLQLLLPITFAAGQKASVSLACKSAGPTSVAATGSTASCNSLVLVTAKLVDAP